MPSLSLRSLLPTSFSLVWESLSCTSRESKYWLFCSSSSSRSLRISIISWLLPVFSSISLFYSSISASNSFLNSISLSISYCICISCSSLSDSYTVTFSYFSESSSAFSSNAYFSLSTCSTAFSKSLYRVSLPISVKNSPFGFSIDPVIFKFWLCSRFSP